MENETPTIDLVELGASMTFREGMLFEEMTGAVWGSGEGAGAKGMAVLAFLSLRRDDESVDFEDVLDMKMVILGTVEEAEQAAEGVVAEEPLPEDPS